jgi:protein SCO1/2
MRGALALAAVLGLCACDPMAGTAFDASGVVRAVRAEERSVTIEHGDIEGLMPAMTMSFDVADPALLDGIEPGQYVEFRLSRRGGKFAIVALDAPGGDAGVAGVSGGAPDPLAQQDVPAPDFALVDQDGRPATLSALRGKPVVLDFVFTRCPGPCPILTGLLADVREGLSAADRAAVHFVSITLDPAFDTPEVLRAYAGARGIDTAGWSFATGPEADVEAVVRAYGVGSTRQPNGDIDHTLATFLISADGVIARRYLGVSHDPDAIRADLERLL